MRYYPVFLDIAGKSVIVIGGGNIAHQKVVGLLKASAELTVVSPDLNQEMASLAAGGRFRHVERDYEPGDLEGYLLAFVATDDRSVNATVAAEGKERRVWVNAVDDPPYCDFIMPGIAQQGNLQHGDEVSRLRPQRLLNGHHAARLGARRDSGSRLRERQIAPQSTAARRDGSAVPTPGFERRVGCSAFVLARRPGA